MKTFEQERVLSGNTERLPEHEEALYAILAPEIAEKALDMDALEGVYEKETIARDKARVEELKKKFSQDGRPESQRKAGKLFEAIAYEGIENAGFLGPDASYIPASAYDDYINKIDGIVEFEEGKGSRSHVALGIDVTKNRVDLSEKFLAIKQGIDKGTLSSVKYFASGNFRGELRNVSRVVVGADERMTEDISHLILSNIRSHEALRGMKKGENAEAMRESLRKKIETNSAKLGDHPLQWIILSEMKDQLAAFRDYAMKKGGMQAAEEYAKIYEIVQEIIKDKEDDLAERGKAKDEEAVREDKVYQLIKEELKNF
jgi:hypothetical protein